MKKHHTPIAAAVFLILGAAWFFTADSQPKVGIKTLSVAAIAKDDISTVTITIPGKEKTPEGAPAEGPVASEREPAKTVILERDGSGFVVKDGAEPSQKFAAEEQTVSGLLDAIAAFAPGDRIANDKGKLAEFEIDDDKALRIAVSTKGGKGLDLLFGRAAKSGGTTVRAAGSVDVFVAKGNLGAMAKKELSAWRKKGIVNKKADDFEGVVVARADGSSIELAATSEDVPAPEGSPEGTAPTKKTTWSLTQPALPAGFRLDTVALSRVAASLATLRATDFADGKSDADAGLAGPHTTVTGRLKGGGTVVLHLGSADDKKRLHVRVDGDPQIYLVPEYSGKNLDKALDDFRDPTLFSATAADVVAATFVSGTTKIVVKKDGAAWKLVEPKAAPEGFDVGQIESAVQGALRLRGTKVLVGERDIGAVSASVEVQLKNGTQRVRFGAPIEGGGDVRAEGGDGLVYAVASFTKARYEKPVELFKKPPPPPQGMGAPGGGGISGLENLPPDVRQKLEASLKQQGLGQ
jgi:hypothetical protein